MWCPLSSFSASTAANLPHRLVLAISDSSTYTAAHGNDDEAARQRFALLPLAADHDAMPPPIRSEVLTLREPLLSGHHERAPGGSVVDKLGFRAGDLAASVMQLGQDACAVSIGLSDRNDVGRTAYLIGDSQSLVLAVPEAVDVTQPRMCLPTSLLPSGVEAVRMEKLESLAMPSARGEAGLPLPTIQLTVEKRVPLVGWALLALALLASQSGGAVTDMQQAATSSAEDNLFLRCAWRGCATTLLMLLLSSTVPNEHGFRALLRSSPSVWLRLLLSGGAFFVNFGCYSFALAHTSLDHAAIFESASSLWIVVGQLLLFLRGSAPALPRPHVVGVAAGGAGMLLCMLDSPTDSTSASTSASVVGDAAAIISGIGSCCYISLAESLRLTLEPTVFYAVVMAQFGFYCTLAAFYLDESPPEFSFDPTRGYFGWLVPSLPGRLIAQIWLAVVVDWLGNVCFIVVMKYVPALVVAGAMLVGPFVATAEGMALGVESMPGPWTIAGSIVIVYGSSLSEMARDPNPSGSSRTRVGRCTLAAQECRLVDEIGVGIM